MIKISVIMPIYNEKLYEVRSSINSILNQTFKNFELIIVDDNPFSQSLKSFLARHYSSNKKIKLLFNINNVGPSISTNKGIRASKGQLIARMDADDISFKNRLKSQINFMKKNNLDLCCFNYSSISEKGSIIKDQCFSRITQTNQRKIKKVMSYCNIANGPSFLFKRKLFNKLGGYRIKDIEDYDFASRALVYGFRLGYQSCSLIYKRARAKSISNSHELIQFVELCSISHYLRKYDFTKIISEKAIQKIIRNINGNDKLKFIKAKNYFKKFKKNHSILMLIKILYLVLSSKLLLKYCIWSRLINNRQERLMK